ncbi:MAG: pseudouridine synthase [Gemmatimonadales bacterium]|nr:pseudouridine synthase [Gemmatimonadales bacterium]
MKNPDNKLRLNRFLARAGFGSRRASEELVRQGRVSINGQTVLDLGRQVDPDSDDVQVDGAPARMPRDFRIYAFHKPLEVVSTLKSQGGQPSLLAYRLQAGIPDRFVPVGRLDSESTGLLLWTDDGQLNQLLCRPHSGVWKSYELELNGPLTPALHEQLIGGKIQLDGRTCLPSRLEMQPNETNRHWVMQIHEGRRRQIRRMFRVVGLKVLHLHRTEVGPVGLGKLRQGDFRRLNQQEESALRKAVEQPD